MIRPSCEQYILFLQQLTVLLLFQDHFLVHFFAKTLLQGLSVVEEILVECRGISASDARCQC